ncbi:MAG: tyrosine-type recombinase/integrase [Proteobacteria bacterium]|nr:tyrosine-type recombinase/integrase [Pseudomonadota bacterium]
MARLSKRFINTLTTPEKDTVYWDDDLPGFGLRHRPSGKMAFICQFRNAQGRTRKITLGDYGRLTPDEARIEARSVLVEVDKGEDPADNRDASRQAPTLKDFAERYLSEHAEPKKKPRSVVLDRSMLNNIILPAMGWLKLQAVTRKDVAKLHYDLRETPYQANRVLALLSKMFNLAERWGLREDGTNPCRHVEKFREKKRERFLSGEELARLGQVLAEAERTGKELPSVITAIRLLIFTGARLSEILGLRWEWIDFEQCCIRLPDSKTGAKDIPLNQPALEELERTPRLQGNPYVIPGARDGQHLVNLNKPWRRIRAKAGLPEVRIHDLRHSYASVAAAAGLGLPIIGALLGHTQAQTTARYSHLAMDPLRAATEEVGKRIAEAMSRQPTQKVIRLPLKK